MKFTTGQNEAMAAFHAFLLNDEQVFVLAGYSGTGKTTLVKELLKQLPSMFAVNRLIAPQGQSKQVYLTATTNKAAENFEDLTGTEVVTIHSFLGLRVETIYQTGEKKLVQSSTRGVTENALIFIDEASYIDSSLLDVLFKSIKDCKVVFIGDPAQLTPVKSGNTPVFKAGFGGYCLTEVVRQASGNQILTLSELFRKQVTTGETFQFKPDGIAIEHLARDDFNDAITSEFNRNDWKDRDSKVLAWTNKAVIGFNQFVSNSISSTPDLQMGDYAVVNNFVASGRTALKTDQTVYISKVGQPTKEHGVTGKYFTLDHSHVSFFVPDYLSEKRARIKLARNDGEVEVLRDIDTWLDLRAAYSCTINKSQGSTYDKVFIDLNDVSKCNSDDQVARMLYVGVSRAKTKVFLTGDIV